MIVAAAPFTDWMVITLLPELIGAYVPSATLIVIPATDLSIARWIVLNACAQLSPRFPSSPFAASTYHVSVHLAQRVTVAFAWLVMFSTDCPSV